MRYAQLDDSANKYELLLMSIGAQSGIRTHTPLRIPGFEPGASTVPPFGHFMVGKVGSAPTLPFEIHGVLSK